MKKYFYLTLPLTLYLLVPSFIQAACSPCQEAAQARLREQESTASGYQITNQNQGEDQQIQVQEQVQNALQFQEQAIEEAKKAEERSGFVRFLFGPDYNALKVMRQQVVQNQMQLKTLEELKTQTQNLAEVQMLANTVQAVNEVNTNLQEQIRAQENRFSLFGWLFKLFAK